MKSIELLTKLKSDVESMIHITSTKYVILDERVLNKRPHPSSWSLLECFEHLNRYLRYYKVEMVRRTIPGTAENNQEVKSTWLGRKSISAMHPDNQKKQKTLKHLNPVNSQVSSVVINEFLQHQRDLLVLIENARKSDVNKVKIPVEFFRLLSLPLGEALEFVVVHQQRHFLQLERISATTAHSKEAALVI